MKLLVTTREQIEAGIAIKSSHIVVSIHDGGDPPAKVKPQPGLVAVLPIGFDNTDPGMKVRAPTSVMMTAEHAQAIWDFVDAHRADVDTIVVHCDSGYSRSPAVAAAIAKILGIDERAFFQGKDPNLHVYDLLLGVRNNLVRVPTNLS